MTALVLSAGGMWAAWEVGAWKVLRERYRFDLIVGASAGTWNGWAIAGGCAPDELVQTWLNPRTADIIRFGVQGAGVFRPEPLHQKSRELFAQYQPRIPFGLTVVEVPNMRVRLFRDGEVTWRHLAASCTIPFGFPPVRIGGKRYVDGGLRGGLPLWAAEEMGATRAIALNVLNTPVFRLLHKTMWSRRPSAALEVILLEPSPCLGSLRDALWWRRSNIERWIEQGERDANRAVTSITI